LKHYRDLKPLAFRLIEWGMADRPSAGASNPGQTMPHWRTGA